MTKNLAGNECLGCGYNVFGEYASPESTTRQLFELGPEETEVHLGVDSYLGYKNGVATYLRLDQTNLEIVFGQTI